MTGCVGEPISWLALERYDLGELTPPERERVVAHLQQCDACQACWVRIEADGARPLQLTGARPLPLTAADATVRQVRRPRATWTWLGALAAAAAAVAIVVLWKDGGPGLEPPMATKRIKGGELAIELVRRGADGALLEPTHYHPDDRFKVLFTCPPPWRGIAQLVIYQDGRAYLPLEQERIDACANRRALPGAFAIDGDSSARVCVATSAEPISRERLERGVGGLPEGSVCVELARDPRE